MKLHEFSIRLEEDTLPEVVARLHWVSREHGNPASKMQARFLNVFINIRGSMRRDHKC